MLQAHNGPDIECSKKLMKTVSLFAVNFFDMWFILAPISGQIQSQNSKSPSYKNLIKEFYKNRTNGLNSGAGPFSVLGTKTPGHLVS